MLYVFRSLLMSRLFFGAFYTKDTAYEQVIQDYFIPSCKKVGIDPIIDVVENKGSWIKNVAEKPRVILSQIDGYIRDNDILVFVDADATIEKYPIDLCNVPPSCEIGYHTLDWNSWYGYDCKVSTKELLSGTMIFRNTENVRQLCKDWYNEAKSSNRWEQTVLQELMKQNSNIKVHNLPIEYCYINSLPDGREPLVKCSPIIKHFQASRKLRKTL